MASPYTLVFDLDGTLVDTAPDLITALNHVLAREGLPPVPMAAARNMIVRAGDLRMAGNPIKLSAFEDPPTRRPAPELDADGASIRHEVKEG